MSKIVYGSRQQIKTQSDISRLEPPIETIFDRKFKHFFHQICNFELQNIIGRRFVFQLSPILYCIFIFILFHFSLQFIHVYICLYLVICIHIF